ncbi:MULTISPECIES: YiaA/YiaB family inner membrane protein [unclassified Bacillus (in: firmicutes)]|uniref:YiaA/YiaB family inner membrane protein n=1 Tax=unclassified Bacillus (in: firmicutes) TaxID=185979 RepID=UPI0008EC3962|nr:MULTISPECIES: YiaA/YiaB family inner membrane protein [unclassified Bacillus (in: firmicutes)]SFJ53482.1 yiaA/B two helix domain-containing protein [Bacillus sp. 71mf]SFT19220.1 yiaA/B two helix domain-containing protein [Bacillus sp. 103mf]
MRKRNTQAFTFLAWTSFVCALSGMLIGIYTLEEPLSVKGYYLIGTLFLTMSSFVLQKTIRDNEEDNEHLPKKEPIEKH